MGSKKGVVKPARVVLDTNIFISALLFAGRASSLVPLWRKGRIIPLISKEIVQEYLRVLSYPKFSLTEKEIHTLLNGEILLFSEAIQITTPFPPTCRDPADDHFLACAVAGKADALVTGDQDLLVLKKTGRSPIVSLDSFLKKVSA